MLDEIIHNKDLERYLKTYQKGDPLFLEGDESQDLYFLVSGHLEVLKGDKKIAEITELGALFGELSFLLGAKRTATVQAENEVRVLRRCLRRRSHAYGASLCRRAFRRLRSTRQLCRRCP